MVKISIMYPSIPDVRFDVDYYAQKHMPLAIQLLSAHPGFKGVSVERGLSAGAPGTTPAYVATCHFLFDSVDNFSAAFAPNAPVLMGDIPNYTNSQPVIQISEVLLTQ